MKAGAEGVSITAVGGTFQVSFVVPSASAGQILHIYRSTDGNIWQNNNPNASCVLDSQKMCAFNTDHLSYFAVASVVATPVVLMPSGGGGGSGGGSPSPDYCPGGDYSSSYYDKTCGVAPTHSNTPSSGSVVTPNNTPSTTSPESTTTTGGKQNLSIVNTFDRELQNIDHLSVSRALPVAQAVTTYVYGRTMLPYERLTILSSLVRYVITKSINASGSDEKAFYSTIQDEFMKTIDALRDQVKLGISITPNRKRNNVSTDTTLIPAGMTVYRYVNVENLLALRLAPNFMSIIKGYLLSNQRVTLLATGPNWSRVKTDDTEGYVRTRLLRQTQTTSKDSPLVVYSAVSADARVADRKDNKQDSEEVE